MKCSNLFDSTEPHTKPLLRNLCVFKSNLQQFIWRKKNMENNVVVFSVINTTICIELFKMYSQILLENVIKCESEWQ